METYPGSPLPLGAHASENGTQFSIFSRNAAAIHLVLLDIKGSSLTYREMPLDHTINRTGDIWHIFVPGVKPGQFYAYRIDGSSQLKEGHRFDPGKLIMDPYARTVIDLSQYCTEQKIKTKEIKKIFHLYDYQPVGIITEKSLASIKQSPGMPLEESIIYELHVRGFTRHESSNVTHKGTYLGLIEKIPYLKELGVTAVELLPVQEFNRFENPNTNPVNGEELTNYWGYSTTAFFSPNSFYAEKGVYGEQVKEFKEMVEAFHSEGIEVILDVVFNHSGEGDENGPTYSFKGIDNRVYYILEEDLTKYRNFSGCGNTLNCNHPLVRDFILDCLRYWVIEMKIDGFRFDLASILGRDTDGTILSDAPLIERIEEDPILRNVKIIAEAWDAAGAYQVGHFPGRWAEWNGKFRDDVRSFWRGDHGKLGAFATRILGSSDLYEHPEKGPHHSINFVTCHDGFTLNDLVSYNKKHNIENGENSKDGENHNISCNYGKEGPHVSDEIKKIRTRQIKNFIATLFLSQGTPMLLAGDEFRRTQNGNNNTYCQDNETAWVNWDLIEEHKEIATFTRELIRFRKEHPLLRRKTFFTGHHVPHHPAPDVQWFDCRGHVPDWSNGDLCLGAVLCGTYTIEDHATDDTDILMIFNADINEQYMLLPEPPQGGLWKLVFDTSLDGSGENIFSGDRVLKNQAMYSTKSRSTVVLVSNKKL